MATVPQVVFPQSEVYRSAQYTGTNSADLNALITDFTITNETATHLTFTSDGQSYTVPHGAYLVYQNGLVTDVFLNQQDHDQAYGNVIQAAGEHYHQVTLTSGPAIGGAPQA